MVLVRGSTTNTSQQSNNNDDDTAQKEQNSSTKPRSRASPTRAHKQGSTHGYLPTYQPSHQLPCSHTLSLSRMLRDALPPVIDRAISALVPSQKTVSPLRRPFPVSL